MNYFDIVVNSIEEFKKLEMYLFTLKLPFKTNGTIYVMENSESYNYITKDLGNGFYTLVTF